MIDLSSMTLIDLQNLRRAIKTELQKRGLRTSGVPLHRSDRMRCPKGHWYIGDNLVINNRGGRRCRTCQNEAARRYRGKHRPLDVVNFENNLTSSGESVSNQ